MHFIEIKSSLELTVLTLKHQSNFAQTHKKIVPKIVVFKFDQQATIKHVF
jgi:hypothetical protein